MNIKKQRIIKKVETAKQVCDGEIMNGLYRVWLKKAKHPGTVMN